MMVTEMPDGGAVSEKIPSLMSHFLISSVSKNKKERQLIFEEEVTHVQIEKK